MSLQSSLAFAAAVLTVSVASTYLRHRAIQASVRRMTDDPTNRKLMLDAARRVARRNAVARDVTDNTTIAQAHEDRLNGVVKAEVAQPEVAAEQPSQLARKVAQALHASAPVTLVHTATNVKPLHPVKKEAPVRQVNDFSLVAITNEYEENAMRIFNQIWNKDYVQGITYDPTWANGTGYLNEAVYAKIDGELGTVVKFTDDHGRRGLMIKSRWDNIVVFERYSTGSNVLVWHAPSEIKMLFGLNGSLSFDQMTQLFTFERNSSENCVTRLEYMFADGAGNIAELSQEAAVMEVHPTAYTQSQG